MPPFRVGVLGLVLVTTALAGCFAGDDGEGSRSSNGPHEAETEPTQEGDTGQENESEEEGPPEGEELTFDVKVTGQFPYLTEDPAFDPDRLEVVWGDTVTVELQNEDSYHHDWSLEGHSDVTTGSVDGGENRSVTFEAPEPGEYTFFCSVEDHRDRGQTGTLVVAEPE